MDFLKLQIFSSNFVSEGLVLRSLTALHLLYILFSRLERDRKCNDDVLKLFSWSKMRVERNKETNFLDTTIFKGEGFHEESILDIRTNFKPTEKFQ